MKARPLPPIVIGLGVGGLTGGRLLLMPVVWAQGNPWNPALPISGISAVLGGLSAVVLKQILQFLNVEVTRQYWTIAAYIFGAGLWMATLSSNDSPSFLAAVVSTLCLLFALRESLIERRGLVAGLLPVVSIPRIFAALKPRVGSSG